ncbi:unnamed protein product [Trichogramma brassicae]|uniref:Ig-like domain-containing protein n=1 Tax=Trichogramma brassicae TaxID=86971 RepID=A0A6H5IGK8_9HYME|nr:unnamed protein product [Trichogramma brassicae]
MQVYIYCLCLQVAQSSLLHTSNGNANGVGGAAAVSNGKSSDTYQNALDESSSSRSSGPYFDKSASKNVTALLGKTTYLNCRVKNLGNKTVSWVRHRDIHLLTIGRYTYTNDQRFRAIHHVHSDDWVLQIKYPQHRDSGIYECQVSTTPHTSHFIHLNVVAQTHTRSVHTSVKLNSPLYIRCVRFPCWTSCTLTFDARPSTRARFPCGHCATVQRDRVKFIELSFCPQISVSIFFSICAYARVPRPFSLVKWEISINIHATQSVTPSRAANDFVYIYAWTLHYHHIRTAAS